MMRHPDSIYDKVPGGIGFSEELYDTHCGCQDGCPSCVGVRPSDETLPFAKRTTRQLLEVLILRAGARTVAHEN